MANLPTPEPISVNAGYGYLEDARFQTTEENFYHPEKTTNSRFQTSEVDFGSLQHINSKENNWTVDSAQNRTSDASSDQIIIHDNTHNRSRSEICGMSNKIWNSSDQVDENQDAPKGIISASHIVFDKRVLTCIDREIPCTEESYFHNQEMKEPDLSNIRIFSSEQNTASNINICQNINPSDILLDYQPSRREDFFSIDATLASLDPSLSYENPSQSNLISEKIQNKFPYESQTEAETKKKTSMCATCKTKVFKNVDERDGRNSKFYCECKYMCNLCGVRYRKEGSHEIEHTCNVCQLSFPCKTRMEDHYLIHEKHHIMYCRIGCRKLDEHVIKNEKRTYKCCQISCPYASESKNNFRRHLYIHSNLELFKCEQCGWRFISNDQLQNHSKYSCNCSG